MHSYRFSAERLRAEAREAELNQAIVDLSREDFLAGNFDLKSLFSVLFDRFYSEDFVLWLSAEEMIGRTAAFQRMADVLEPINTLLEMGLASIESFRRGRILERLYIDNCLPLTVELFHQLAFFILSSKPISYCRFKRIDVYIL
jgi:hypothetical protein